VQKAGVEGDEGNPDPGDEVIFIGMRRPGSGLAPVMLVLGNLEQGPATS
jgi:hypothetical protein